MKKIAAGAKMGREIQIIISLQHSHDRSMKNKLRLAVSPGISATRSPAMLHTGHEVHRPAIS